MSDFIRNLRIPIEDKRSFIERLSELHHKVKNYPDRSTEYYIDLIESFLKRNPAVEYEDEPIENVFDNGIDCKLLQPDGKGWQKGRLKICFEFIPEDNELMTSQEKPLDTHSSPLDEIRQLSNELTSMTSLAEPPRKRIEQN
ncbi:KGK domain-containing protein [Chamaesiphon sp. OTE_75_metabat_556]|jgi:KGK domain|uniref:KGK domain-containing protein n=1 Tax=Chamaesiphon sp. OTE_75_metabat_556 TaxID=2964692 RepID=UPI00286CACA2|nr:KGK domain-containing protein [Chamaesiphon sp. OTE_75_metabat_556]